MKILREDLAEDAELRRRFHEESQAVAMLSHPNIVAVYDVSRSSDLEYIVMELIDGITLKQYMQKKGNKLNWREALHFITQIVKALGHAHSRGIIHRDIKAPQHHGPAGRQREGGRLRHRPGGLRGPQHPSPRRLWGRCTTSRRSRPGAATSTPGPTCTPPAWCSMR